MFQNKIRRLKQLHIYPKWIAWMARKLHVHHGEQGFLLTEEVEFKIDPGADVTLLHV